jgi:large subunit ribosomal protein L6e
MVSMMFASSQTYFPREPCNLRLATPTLVHDISPLYSSNTFHPFICDIFTTYLWPYQKFTFKYESTVATKGAKGKYYPAEDVVLPKGPAPVRNAPKVRASCAPGAVLILVAGRFRGKRVVCLKKLTSGLLLVTGPYSSNGVPLRRVNQKYVIATSTNVPVTGVKVDTIDDAFFARSKDEEKSKATRKAAQAAVDAALTANIAKIPMLDSYLKARFSLKNGDKPHALKF